MQNRTQHLQCRQRCGQRPAGRRGAPRVQQQPKSRPRRGRRAVAQLPQHPGQPLRVRAQLCLSTCRQAWYVDNVSSLTVG